MNFSSIFSSVINYFTPGKQDIDLEASLLEFKAMLGEEETIRMWISAAPGYAYLTNTVNLLLQLTNNAEAKGLEYKGTVEVYYQENKSNTILSQLYNLLPSMDRKTEGTVNEATVKLIAWKKGDAPPKEVVKLGFTGAEQQDRTAKFIKTSPALAARVNTTYFLRLEPYLWSSPDEIQFLDVLRSTVNLAKQKPLQYGAFGQRPLWSGLPMAEPDWNYYSLHGFAAQVETLQSLLEHTGDYDLCLVSDISTGDDYQLRNTAAERMFAVITAMMASQMEDGATRKGARPIVILSMDAFSDESGGADPSVQQLIRGAMTAREKSWQTDIAAGGDGIKPFTQKKLNELRQLVKPAGYRAQYLEQADAEQRIRYIWDISSEPVADQYNWLNAADNRVLLVQVGKVPGPVFDYMMQQATMPPVFRSSDTANLAIRLGKPYLQVTKPNDSKVQYPTTLFGYTAFDLFPLVYTPMVYVPRLVSGMQRIANNINSPLELWPAASEKNPAETIGAFIRTYASSEEGAYHKYYKDVETSFQDIANDKFRIGAGYLNYIMQPPDPGKSPLPALLKKLNDNLDKDNILNMFPGVYGSGAIYDFVSGLLGIKLFLTQAKITPVYKEGKEDVPEKITVTGESDALDGIPLAFELTFTSPFGSVLSEWKMTYTGDWLTNELPWLQFNKPYVLFVVADAMLPAQGSVGGTLEGLELDLSIRMPIAQGVWQLEGHFDTPASVARFFQLAGGVNLVQALPAPFNALSAIGVTDCQLAYDSNLKKIQYISFVMATDDPVQLMQGLTMDNISINVLVQDPGSLAERTTTWSIAGKFIIGDKDAEDAGVVIAGMDYPGPVISCQLGSGVIKVTDLFNLFLPGTEFLPQGYLPEVTEFEASFDGTSGDYSVTANLNFDWTFQIVPEAPSLTINNVGVRVQSEEQQLQGGISGGIVITDKNKKPVLDMSLTAGYDTKEGWVFTGQQTPDTDFYLTTLISQFLPSDWDISDTGPALKNLRFEFHELNKYYEFSGATGLWKIDFLDLKVTGNLKFGYGKYKSEKSDKDNKDQVKLLPGSGKTILLKEEDPVGYYCTVNADIDWIGIKMKLFYDYNPRVLKYGFTWGFLTGYITDKEIDGVVHKIGTLKFTESVTLGSIIEEVISWCTGYKFGLGAPWNLLNSIPLSALELVYDFTDQTVSFQLNVGKIDLGFCKIEKIGVNYQSGKSKKEEKGVFVTIEGSFFWLSGNDNPPGQSADKIKWDASKPESTPAPSGQGNKYLDLRLLALGQHVTIPGFASVNSVQEAIAAMAKLPDTEAGKIPGIVFDANSSWLIGMDFGVLKLQEDKKDENGKSKALLAKDKENESGSGYFIDLQIVFNDSNLYALRIALSGEPARIFKGLDFQVLYRKISDSVGVYQAQIALPDIMRKIQLGAVNITLPVFGIEVYTNGDFVVDLGFPKNADFSRSFTLQMIIYVPVPIPIMGSAGLYFGKKSSATSSEVPVVDNGTFNPVLVFGIGIQFGLGYDFNAGILAAGFSLTFVAIIEGVLAKFNPYQVQDISTGTQSDIAPAYYYSVKGVVGIQGKLYGYVDFKIIKAEVSISLSVLADITITAYAPIALGLTASVSVSVSVKINLGFFSISIGFSFSMTIRQSYEIKAGGGKAPWNTVSAPRHARLTAVQHPALAATMMFVAAGGKFNTTPTWSNLAAAAAKAPLKAYLGLGLSIAGDMAVTPSDQQAVYTAMMFIESAAPGKKADAPDTSFAVLSRQVFRWVIAAFHNGSLDAAAVDDLVIGEVLLKEIFDFLNNAENSNPIPAAAIDAFLAEQVAMTVSHPSEQQGQADAAYFPMAPGLSVDLPANGAKPALSYAFGKYNTLSEDYIHDLRMYFDELTVKMQEEEGLLKGVDARLQNDPESLATFIYTDYFLLIARQMVQYALDALESFRYTPISGKSADDIVAWVNANGQFEGGYSYTAAGLFRSNKSHALAEGKMLRIHAATCTTMSGDTFDTISKKTQYGNGFTAAELATLNADNIYILQDGAVVTYPDKIPVLVHAGNSLKVLAGAFGVSLDDLLAKSNALQLGGLLVPSSGLALPPFDGSTLKGDTLVSFSARYNISIDDLSADPANTALAGLFGEEADDALFIEMLPQFRTGELIKEIQYSDGIGQLSGMASRYYLSGLRLPTAGINPEYQGMWLDAQLRYQQATAGLFSLTGQQFPCPVLTEDEACTVSFTIPGELSWMTFDTGNKLDIVIDGKSVSYSRADTVRSYAQQNYLDLDTERIGMGELFSSSFGHYSFSSVSPWQPGAPFSLPYGNGDNSNQSLNIWTLPNDLINLADPAGRAVAPRFEVLLGTPDPVSRAVQSTPVVQYGWGTQVTFSIKRVPLSPDSPASATTYEISGADGNNALILEQMVTHIGNNNGLISRIAFGFAPDRSGGAGMQSDPQGSLTIGIAQANLSTFTRPESVLKGQKMMIVRESQSTLLNSPSEMITLLWQASITRDGGYYLYYFNSENGAGLPDHIFNDKGEALLSLTVLYSAPNADNERNRLQPYMNIFVSGDPVNTATSTLFARSAPVRQTVAFKPEDSLSSLAYAWFANIGDIVADNPEAILKTGNDVLVAEGVYQVLDTSGENLAAIAAVFGTTPDAIKAANPQVKDWPDPLPLYTSLRLPPLTVKAGDSDHTRTFGAIAAFYGMDLTALASYNAGKADIYAANTNLSIAGGPVTRVATVPAGVMSLEAMRKEPAPVPDKPDETGYALLFLRHNFSILTFRVTENAWFRGSSPSLPAGPTDTPSGLAPGLGRDLTGKWIFRQSVPYAALAKQPALRSDGMPDISTSPYRGIGYLLQPEFSWLDIYGNTVLTTLSQPPAGEGANKAPLLTGYTDTLLGVNQWPSVAAMWLVKKVNDTKIQIPLSFDISAYSGLMSAKAATADSILLSFTDRLDSATANDMANYKLSPELAVSAAMLQSDGKSVMLTVGGLADDLQYTVAIGNIRDEERKLTFSGQATFAWPDSPLLAGSSLIQQAAHDLQVYTQLWYQLTDPNGIALTMNSSLYPGISFDTGAPVLNELTNDWIAPIYRYLQDRSMGQTGIAAPPESFVLEYPIDPSKVNSSQIFEIALSLTMTRTGGAVMGDFETTGGIRQVTTPVPPATTQAADATKGLDDFTTAFEQAMSADGQYYLKIATGADRDKLGQQSPDGTIWAVRLGVNDSSPIAYSVNNPGQPALFAPRPVSNRPESRPDVEIYNYRTGKGIDFSKPDSVMAFTEVDLDQWIATFFAAVDNLLTPEFTASLQLIDKRMNTAYLHQIQDYKEKLADIAKQLMAPVFADEAADAGAVREALKQALLVKLMNLYATNSGIRFDVNVKADATTGTPPNLYGNLMQNTVFEGAVSQEDSLNKVSLYFSAPLDPSSAKNTGNYTVTDGLTVTAALLSDDGQRVLLTLSGNAVLGSTIVTIGDGLMDADLHTIQGERKDTVTTSYTSYAKPDQLTITSAKVSLLEGSPQALAFLLTTPEIVRGQEGEVLSKINLNLRYKATDIEHQIGQPVNGFTPSSWLSFVQPQVRVPLEKQLGGFEVPMFLRSFPVNPSLLNQSGLTPNQDDRDISKLLQWSYMFEYAQSFHYPQDTLYCTVNFNVSEKEKPERLMALPDAFPQLAEFVVVYPGVETDIKAFVTKIDAATFNKTGPDIDELFRNAGIAVSSFAEMTRRIVEAASAGGLRMPKPQALKGSKQVAPYPFTIQEGPKNLNGQQVQVVSINGAPPTGVGVPWVLIDPENWEPKPWENEDDPCSGTFCYYYVNRKDGKPLLSEEAQGIQNRQVLLPELNILERQDAQTSVYLTRNEHLIRDRKTNPDFVYTTGNLDFSNPCMPAIDSDQPIELADLPANQDQPAVRSLSGQLKVLMDTLLKENKEDKLSFQLVCGYSYMINPSLPPVSIPVFMQAMIEVNMPEGLEALVQQWTDAIETWMKTNQPNRTNGNLLFELVIFSSLTRQPYPLIRLRNLSLSLDYIDPQP